jgi:hypothetical protein
VRGATERQPSSPGRYSNFTGAKRPKQPCRRRPMVGQHRTGRPRICTALTYRPIRQRFRHGLNRHKLEAERKAEADEEAAARRANDAQVLEERLIAAWNERQARRMPVLFSPTIGAAITPRHWFLWVRCPVCRTINAVDLGTLDRHRDAAVTNLIPSLSCRERRGRNARG